MARGTHPHAQFSAGIVILCEAFCILSHHPGATRHLAGTVGNRTHPSGFGDRLSSLGTFAPKCPSWDTSLRGAEGPVKMAQTAGLEPATFSLLAKRSCLLSYVCIPPASTGVGERKDENEGKKRMCEIHSHTSIVALFNSVFPLKRGIFNFYHEALKCLPSADNPSAP